jgi:hypothetical protein
VTAVEDLEPEELLQVPKPERELAVAELDHISRDLRLENLLPLSSQFIGVVFVKTAVFGIGERSLLVNEIIGMNGCVDEIQDSAMNSRLEFRYLPLVIIAWGGLDIRQCRFCRFHYNLLRPGSGFPPIGVR